MSRRCNSDFSAVVDELRATREQQERLFEWLKATFKPQPDGLAKLVKAGEKLDAQTSALATAVDNQKTK